MCRPELRLKTTNTSLNFYSIYIYIRYNIIRIAKGNIFNPIKNSPLGEGRKEGRNPTHPSTQKCERTKCSQLLFSKAKRTINEAKIKRRLVKFQRRNEMLGNGRNLQFCAYSFSLRHGKNTVTPFRRDKDRPSERARERERASRAVAKKERTKRAVRRRKKERERGNREKEDLESTQSC